jgi:DNA-binding beta-propeller fold protein YncE
VDRREFLLAAGAPLVLGAMPAAAARAGGTPLALVTADLESHVAAVDVGTGKVVRRLRTPADPRSIEGVGVGAALVAHTEAGRLTLIDSALRVHPVAGSFGEPRYTAVSPDRRLAYVTDSGRQELAVVDVRGRRVIGRVPVGGPCRHLAIDRTGSRLWVALGNKAPALAIVSLAEPRRPRVVGTIRPPFLAHDVVFAPDGRTVWVTSGDERRIALYTRERRPRRVLAADAPPQHVAFARDKAFVASGDDGTMHRHLLDGELVREARVPLGSYNVAFGGSTVVTPSLGGGTVALLDRNGRVRGVRRIARAAHDACVVAAS